MKHEISRDEFFDAFTGRNGWSDTYSNNFSYEGLDALFEYLEELEDSIGESIDFDRVAIACDFSEYECFERINEAYGDRFESIEDLHDYTTVIEVGHDTDRIIIQQF